MILTFAWNILAGIILGFMIVGFFDLVEVDDKYKTYKNYILVFLASMLIVSFFLY